MAALPEDRRRHWEPFGLTEAEFAAAPERDGMPVAVVRFGGEPGAMAGRWLAGAAGVLALLAAGAAAVSWQAQYMMVRAVKHAVVVAAIEAGIPDAGALVFAALGVALALHGKRALRARALNAASIGISLAMNALSAGHGVARPGDLGDARRGVRAGLGHADRRGPRLGAGPPAGHRRDAGR